jgi:hypothetical protein
MAFEFVESLRQVASSNHNMGGSKATMVGFVDPAKYDLPDVITEIIGSSTPKGNGALIRVLPLAHPLFPWLFAENVALSGVSFDSNGTTSGIYTNPLEAPALPTFAKYLLYRCEITFAPRPYTLLQDAEIEVGKMDWIDDNGKAQNSIWAKEWDRFVDYDEVPSAEFITAQQGQFKFRAEGGAGANNPNGATLPGQVRIIQRKTGLKIFWYQVPITYLEPNSRHYGYIYEALGHVNQIYWNSYDPGTLLFQAMSYRRYVPAYPGWKAGLGGTTGGIISPLKLVDLEMTFSRFDPEKDPAHLPPAGVGNNVPGGHNLLPWFGAGGRYHYYVESTLNQKPVYPSFPFQLLFSDPDAV